MVELKGVGCFRLSAVELKTNYALSFRLRSSGISLLHLNEAQ